MTPRRLLLGPQRPDINLDSAVATSGVGDNPIGVISAGWQEAEGDLDDVQRLIGNTLIDLRVYQRAEELFAADSRLYEAYRARQDRLKELQRLYRLRLRQLMIAARQTLRTEGDPAMVAAERRHAISQLRALDRHHLKQVQKAHLRFDASCTADRHHVLADKMAEVEDDLSRCETILITGGNVVVLMNRLRLFGLGRHLREKHVIAWSAGAMILCDRVVLFHDRMPQGRRDAELMCEGAGVLPGLVVLPDAAGRLRHNDRVRVSLFSRRFSPATCVTLDNGAHMLFEGKLLLETRVVRRITRDGKLKKVRTL